LERLQSSGDLDEASQTIVDTLFDAWDRRSSGRDD